MVFKIKTNIQHFDHCVLQEVTVSPYQSLTISYCICFITLEKYYTVHLTTQVKNKYHRSFYKIFAYRHSHKSLSEFTCPNRSRHESIILYIQTLRCHCLKGMLPVVLPFVRI